MQEPAPAYEDDLFRYDRPLVCSEYLDCARSVGLEQPIIARRQLQPLIINAGKGILPESGRLGFGRITNAGLLRTQQSQSLPTIHVHRRRGFVSQRGPAFIESSPSSQSTQSAHGTAKGARSSRDPDRTNRGAWPREELVPH